MDEPVFSAEYAVSLVQRARDGATFDQMRPTTRWSTPSYEWRQVKPLDHWVQWYREASAGESLASAHWGGSSQAWRDTAIDLSRLKSAFVGGVLCLGSLCQLPDEWTLAHREAAREMRTR